MWFPRRTFSIARSVVAGCCLAVAVFGAALAIGADVVAPAKDADVPRVNYTTRSLRGKVVYLAPALNRQFGVKAVPEARERILALQTPQGTFHPLLEDVRGRSFRKDKRLRGIDVELLVRQYDGSPMVQVIQVFALHEGHKYELDYWCEICAIAMFELKACDCCQGDIELRRRRVEAKTNDAK